MSIEVNDEQLNGLMDILWRMTKGVDDSSVLKVIRSVAKKEIYDPLQQQISSQYGELSKSVKLKRDKTSVMVGITKGYSNTSQTSGKKIGGYVLRWLEYGTNDRYIKKGNRKAIKSLLRKTRGEVISQVNDRKGYRGKEPKKAFILDLFRNKMQTIKQALFEELNKKISKLSRG